MKMRKILTFATLLVWLTGSEASAKDYTVASPNGKNIVTVSDGIKITVSHNSLKVVDLSLIHI